MGDLLDIPIAEPKANQPDNNPNSTSASSVAIGPSSTQPTATLTIETAPAQTTTPAPPSPSTATVIPDVSEMEKTLQESGKLLNEIGISQTVKVDTSPLAALQPQNMLLTKAGPQPIRLPSEHEMPLLGIKLANSGDHFHLQLNFKAMGQLLFKWLIVFLYATLGIFSLLKSGRFFFIDFPNLETSQAMLGSDNQSTTLLTLNLVVLIAAVLLLVSAFKVITNKQPSFSFLALTMLVATVCWIANTQISLTQAKKINGVGEQMSGQSQSLTNSLLDLVPFLKRQEDGTVKPVWYKDVTQPY